MRVLVVGTVRPSHVVLLREGHDVTLFVAKDKLGLVSVQDAYASVVVHAPEASDALLLDVARALHRVQPFDRVLSYTDLAQETAHQIAQGLGVPSNVDVGLVRRTANKAAMRDELARASVPSCRYAFAQGSDALRAAIAAIGLPCIVKPVAGQASRGVAKIVEPADIDAALAWVGQDDIAAGVMVEEFLFGEEFSVEALSHRGEHFIYSITQKFKSAETFVETGHLVPAPLDDERRAAIASYARQALTALGFDSGPSHTEIILTATGPRIVETHTRLAGDKIIDLVRHATGEDLYEIATLQSLGVDVSVRLGHPIETRQNAAIWYACPDAPPYRALIEVAGVDGVKSRPDVKHVEVLLKPGAMCGDVRHSHDRYAFVIAVGASGDAALATARAGIAGLEFVCAPPA